MFIAEDCIWTPYGTNSELDKFVDHIDFKIREETAKHGYGLDKLVYDENEYVRRAVADQGYGLDILVNDSAAWVREKVAKHNYGLDKLVYDPDKYVRLEVARKGYGLNILINDKESLIREEVANNGYGLHILINDDSTKVRSEVYSYLDAMNLTLTEWCIQEGKYDSGLTDYLIKIFSIINTLNSVKVETNSDISIKDFFNDFSNEPYEENDFIYITPIDIHQILFKIEKSIENNEKIFKFIVNISESNFSYNIATNIISKDNFHKILKSTLDILHEYLPLTKYICEIEEIL